MFVIAVAFFNVFVVGTLLDQLECTELHAYFCWLVVIVKVFTVCMPLLFIDVILNLFMSEKYCI